MSEALIDDVAAAAAALKKAMQSADSSAMEAAVLHFRGTLDAVKAVDSWQSDPALKAKLSNIMAELDSSQMIARLMGDITGQAQDAMARSNPDAPQPLYKPGR